MQIGFNPSLPPYASAALATAALGVQAAGPCLVWSDLVFGTPTQVTASFSSGLLSGTSGRAVQGYFSANLRKNAQLYMDYVITPTSSPNTPFQIFLGLFDCLQSTLVDSVSLTLPTGNGRANMTSLIPASDEYIVAFSLKDTAATRPTTTFSITTDDGLMTMNDIIALWDDGGGSGVHELRC